MTLKEYKKTFVIPYTQIARKCKCAASYITNIANGLVVPSEKIARLIEKATEGHVPRNSWVRPPRPPRVSTYRRPASITVKGISRAMLKAIAAGWPDSAGDPDLTFKIRVTVIYKKRDTNRARVISQSIQDAFDNFKSNLEGTQAT